MDDKTYCYAEIENLEIMADRGVDDIHTIAMALVSLCKILTCINFPEDEQKDK